MIHDIHREVKKQNNIFYNMLTVAINSSLSGIYLIPVHTCMFYNSDSCDTV